MLIESVDDIIDFRSFIVGQAYGVNFDTYRFLYLVIAVAYNG